MEYVELFNYGMIKLDGMKKSLILASFIAGIIVISIPSITAQSESGEIPEWVKGVAGFWVDDGIDDGEFIEALVFLIENEIIEIPGYGKIVIPEEETKLMALTINTDKQMYVIDEKIKITGALPNDDQDSISLLFLSPSNNIVSIKSINANGSGEYSTSLKIDDELIIEDGDYILRIQYQGEKIETTISFDVS